MAPRARRARTEAGGRIRGHPGRLRSLTPSVSALSPLHLGRSESGFHLALGDRAPAGLQPAAYPAAPREAWAQGAATVEGPLWCGCSGHVSREKRLPAPKPSPPVCLCAEGPPASHDARGLSHRGRLPGQQGGTLPSVSPHRSPLLPWVPGPSPLPDHPPPASAQSPPWAQNQAPHSVPSLQELPVQ